MKEIMIACRRCGWLGVYQNDLCPSCQRCITCGVPADKKFDENGRCVMKDCRYNTSHN